MQSLSKKYSILAPLKTFTGSKIDMSTLRNKEVWVCAAHVLDPKLQDGKKLPKWNHRARQE